MNNCEECGWPEPCDCEPERSAGSLERAGSASVLELGHAKSHDAHCLACGFQMIGGRYVGLCPKCGSDRWYRTKLTPSVGRAAGVWAHEKNVVKEMMADNGAGERAPEKGTP